LCPNGWMDQDATWYGGRPRPKRYSVRWEPSRLPSLKSGHTPSPIFAPCLLWPNGNGCMDQDATWYGDRPRPKPHCDRWGPSSPSSKRGKAPIKFSAHVCCGQTAGWIKMPLGTKVAFGPGCIVLHGDPAPPHKRGTTLQFSAHVYCGQTVAHLSCC